MRTEAEEEKDDVPASRGNPPRCMFVLTFLTIKPQVGARNSIWQFRDKEKEGSGFYFSKMGWQHLRSGPPPPAPIHPPYWTSEAEVISRIRDFYPTNSISTVQKLKHRS